MITYSFHTYEGCLISCRIEGQHVASGLDELLRAKRGSLCDLEPGATPKLGLRVPYLADALLVHLVTMKALSIVEAAHHGGCMPGMILEALTTIKARCCYWVNKAKKYEETEARRMGKKGTVSSQDEEAPPHRAHGGSDEEKNDEAAATAIALAQYSTDAPATTEQAETESDPASISESGFELRAPEVPPHKRRKSAGKNVARRKPRKH